MRTMRDCSNRLLIHTRGCRVDALIDARVFILPPGLEKPGRIVAFCDWNARFCDQKTLCSRNFAPETRRPGASLRPDEHSSRPDSENKNVETAFVSNSDERERRESCQLLVMTVGSRTKTVDVRSDLQASSCGTWPGPLRLALPDPSIDRRSYMQSDVGNALFLTLAEQSS